jgi:hypothetical protein
MTCISHAMLPGYSGKPKPLFNLAEFHTDVTEHTLPPRLRLIHCPWPPGYTRHVVPREMCSVPCDCGHFPLPLMGLGGGHFVHIPIKCCFLAYGVFTSILYCWHNALVMMATRLASLLPRPVPLCAQGWRMLIFARNIFHKIYDLVFYLNPHRAFAYITLLILNSANHNERRIPS